MITDIYIRVSTKKQSYGDGLRRQKDRCLDFCQLNNLKVRNIIQDIGSAYKAIPENLNSNFNSWRKWYWDDKNEPLNQNECSLDVVKIKPPDILLVENVDRFSRKPFMEIVFLLSLLESIGIGFATVDTKNIINISKLLESYYKK